MLSIRPSSTTAPAPTNPNLLPCHIHHDGPANATTKHWTVTETSDAATATTTKTAYFRGRKLVGKDLLLPAGYTGRILDTTTEVVKPDREEDEDEEEDEPDAETTVFCTLGVFDAITVWGHEQAPGAETRDGVLRGMEEWVGFAGKINSWEEGEEDETEKK